MLALSPPFFIINFPLLWIRTILCACGPKKCLSQEKQTYLEEGRVFITGEFSSESSMVSYRSENEKPLFRRIDTWSMNAECLIYIIFCIGCGQCAPRRSLGRSLKRWTVNQVEIKMVHLEHPHTHTLARINFDTQPHTPCMMLLLWLVIWDFLEAPRVEDFGSEALAPGW